MIRPAFFFFSNGSALSGHSSGTIDVTCLFISVFGNVRMDEAAPGIKDFFGLICKASPVVEPTRTCLPAPILPGRVSMAPGKKEFLVPHAMPALCLGMPPWAWACPPGVGWLFVIGCCHLAWAHWLWFGFDQVFSEEAGDSFVETHRDEGVGDHVGEAGKDQ